MKNDKYFSSNRLSHHIAIATFSFCSTLDNVNFFSFFVSRLKVINELQSYFISIISKPRDVSTVIHALR